MPVTTTVFPVLKGKVSEVVKVIGPLHHVQAAFVMVNVGAIVMVLGEAPLTQYPLVGRMPITRPPPGSADENAASTDTANALFIPVTVPPVIQVPGSPIAEAVNVVAVGVPVIV